MRKFELPTLIKELDLVLEAVRREQLLQQLDFPLERDVWWFCRQAQPTGNVPTTTPLSYVATPLKPVAQGGIKTCPNNNTWEHRRCKAQSGTGLTRHNQGAC